MIIIIITIAIVSLVAVFRMSRNVPERCVTPKRTAVRETTIAIKIVIIVTIIIIRIYSRYRHFLDTETNVCR